MSIFEATNDGRNSIKGEENKINDEPILLLSRTPNFFFILLRKRKRTQSQPTQVFLWISYKYVPVTSGSRRSSCGHPIANFFGYLGEILLLICITYPQNIPSDH
jgi:hypothetical protein